MYYTVYIYIYIYTCIYIYIYIYRERERDITFWGADADGGEAGQLQREDDAAHHGLLDMFISCLCAIVVWSACDMFVYDC